MDLSNGESVVVSSNQGLFLLGHAGAGAVAGGDILTMNMIIQTTDTEFRSKGERLQQPTQTVFAMLQ